MLNVSLTGSANKHRKLENWLRKKPFSATLGPCKTLWVYIIRNMMSMLALARSGANSLNTALVHKQYRWKQFLLA